jgi:hypothetical protein
MILLITAFTDEEGVRALFTGQKEREREIKTERGRERKKGGRESCMHAQAESAGVL